MSYKLAFLPKALKEWKELDNSIKEQFKKVLAKRLENPHIQSAKLSGFDNVYKIKLKKLGYRLAYKVEDEIVTVTVIAIGVRDKDKIYNILKNRMDNLQK